MSVSSTDDLLFKTIVSFLTKGPKKASLFLAHPVIAYLWLQSKVGHAWSFLVLKKAGKERQACPRAYCT
ncbi:MAG: hypothetical protein WBG50_02195, partial [Desulfomonilaceae bacterium]